MNAKRVDAYFSVEATERQWLALAGWLLRSPDTMKSEATIALCEIVVQHLLAHYSLWRQQLPDESDDDYLARLLATMRERLDDEQIDWRYPYWFRIRQWVLRRILPWSPEPDDDTTTV